ncbi:hypothetical protein PR048_009903 [Dryococelus australis]|uniref:Uncharacterized protein n=1 Tax=Dryococelus australis TaxID=614101 RepID=A0ABQ9I290_9NEOP|nr:hypothetical protein PR048_009903 [Dryococelus australis]
MRTKYPSITHEFDVWCLSKSLAKKLKAIEKHSYLIQAWSQTTEKHLLTLASTMIYRIRKDQGSSFKQTVIITACKNYCHTRKLESFHSIALKYKPKRNHFSYDSIVACTILSILDFKNNTRRSRKGSKLKYSKPLKQWVGRKEILECLILVVEGKLQLELDNDPHCATSVPKCIAPVPRPD